MNRLGMLFLLLGCALVQVTPRAQCVTIPVDVPRQFRSSDFVFSGTLLKHERDDSLTFRVERIWKGPDQAEAVVYVVYDPPTFRANSESYFFRPDTKYLIFAKALSVEERLIIGAPDNAAYGTPSGCGAPPWPLSLSNELDQLAKPTVPQHR